MRHISTVTLIVAALFTSGCESRAPEEQTRPASGPEAVEAPTSTQPGTVALFNGRNLAGWTCELADPNAKMQDVWPVADGVLVCKGEPSGYLRTEKDYENYVLTLEWRWPAGTKGGNNGVLVHASTPRALDIWPKSIEVQLQTGEAGDLWIIGTDLEVKDQAARRRGRRHLNLTDDSEKPLGEWNQMEITCKGDEIMVKVNGDLVNHATNCSVTKGAICLQSEGAPIEYRNIRLARLEP